MRYRFLTRCALIRELPRCNPAIERLTNFATRCPVLRQQFRLRLAPSFFQRDGTKSMHCLTFGPRLRLIRRVTNQRVLEAKNALGLTA